MVSQSPQSLNLTSKRQYTRELCEEDCLLQFVMDNCSCTLNTDRRFLKKTKEGGFVKPLCGFESQKGHGSGSCQSDSLTWLARQAVDCAKPETQTHDVFKCKCACLRPCSKVDYAAAVFSTPWPSARLAQLTAETDSQFEAYSDKGFQPPVRLPTMRGAELSRLLSSVVSKTSD